MGVRPTQLTIKQPAFQKFRPDYDFFQNLQNLHECWGVKCVGLTPMYFKKNLSLDPESSKKHVSRLGIVDCFPREEGGRQRAAGGMQGIVAPVK